MSSSVRAATRGWRLMLVHVTVGPVALIAAFADGRLITTRGFGGLALATFVIGTMVCRDALARDLRAHRRWMIRGFAMLLAAVILRFELPLLARSLDGFLPADDIVAWSGRVPNPLLAEWIARRTLHPA